MKVTVCFGTVRVVVPCGSAGELTVRSLITEAVSRYKKATNKPANCSVIVHRLISSTDSGILNEDDLVREVADDRDQIIAEFDEKIVPPLNDENSAVTSCRNMLSHVVSQYNNNNNNNDKVPTLILDTGRMSTRKVQPVRCELPLLSKNGVGISTNDNDHAQTTDPKLAKSCPGDESGSLIPSPTNSDTDVSLQSSFVRDSSRKSLGNGLSMTKWFVAQERIGDGCTNELLSNGNGSEQSARCSQTSMDSPLPGSESSCLSKSDGMLLQSSPQAPPRHSRHARHSSDSAHAVQIHEGSPSCIPPARRCRPQSTVGEPSLTNSGITDAHAVPHDTRTLAANISPVRLNNSEIESAKKLNTSGSKTPVSAPGLSPSRTGVLAPTNTRLIGNKMCIDLVKGSQGLGFSVTSRDNLSGSNCPIYIKNILPSGAAIDDGRLKPGDRLLEVNGVKMTGKSQSEAVAILRGIPPDGVARLVISRQVVDDAEEVAAAAELSNASIAADITSTPKPSSPVPPADVGVPTSPKPASEVPLRDKPKTPVPSDDCERLTFHVALGEAGLASLGISVTKVTRNRRDLGIFIKSVMMGGTAAKDGRLRVNDQLVEVNGISLLGMDNVRAILVLREAMQKEGRVRGFIGITVLRRKGTNAIGQQPVGPREVRVSQADADESYSGLQRSVSDVTSAPPVTPASCRTLAAVSESDLSPSDRRVAEEDSENLQQADTLKLDDEDFVCDEMSPDDADVTPAFHREGFGRQSISEKRKCHIDPKNLDLYQKIKCDRTQLTYASWDPRKSPLHKSAASKSNNLIREMALKRYKSLEDFQLAPVTQESDEVPAEPAETSQGSDRSSDKKSSRVCGVNESFRAAVDRSYDVPDSAEVMETVEEDTNEGEAVCSPSPLSKVEGRPVDKGWGIWKGFTEGLSGLFRMGMGRQKKADDVQRENDIATRGLNHSSKQYDIVREVSKTTKFYVPEDFRSWQDQRQGNCSGSHQSGTSNHSVSLQCPPDTSQSEKVAVTKSKLERIQELRRQFQQSHRERQGRYPLDEKEEKYEQQLRLYEQKRQEALQSKISHTRSQSGPVVMSPERLTYQLESKHTQRSHRRAKNPYHDQHVHIDLPDSYSRTPSSSHSQSANPTSPDFDAVCSPGVWGHEASVISGSAPDSTPLSCAARSNLPMRHHLAHIPITANDSPSYDFDIRSKGRRSYREIPAEPTVGAFHQRFVSLPTRHQRRYGPVVAHPAQV